MILSLFVDWNWYVTILCDSAQMELNLKRSRQLIILVVSLLLAACGTSSEISVVDAWARPALAGNNNAAYFQLFNGSNDADALLSIEGSVARAVEMHETMTMDIGADEMDGMVASSGMEMEALQMVPQERIELAQGETVVFEPGGLHVMLIELQQELLFGDEIELTFNFESGLSLIVITEIKDQ
jgi:hypothetical protein